MIKWKSLPSYDSTVKQVYWVLTSSSGQISFPIKSKARFPALRTQRKKRKVVRRFTQATQGPKHASKKK